MFQIFHYAVYFVVGSKRAVYTLRITGAGWQEQHIALAEQVFCAHLVKNRAAVDFAGYLEGNACRNIGFNQAGNDIHAWALGGKN